MSRQPFLHRSAEIRRFNAADTAWFEAAYALYVHDLSAYGGAYQLDEQGVWQPDYRSFWRDAELPGDLWLIWWGDRRVGFACVGAAGFPYKSDGCDARLCEFFVLRSVRRLAVGRNAAEALLAAYRGRWELAVLQDNAPALGFWRKCLGHLPGFEEVGDGEDRLFYVESGSEPS